MANENTIPDEWADINLQQIEQEYARISSMIMRAGKLKSNAKRDVGEAKVDLSRAGMTLEQVEGLLYLKYRNDPDLATEDSKGKIKLPTEGTINSAMRQDEQWVEAKEAVHDCELAVVDAQHTFDLCWEALEALKAKKDMINNVAADRRTELKSLS
jgi:hypothetical protein